MVEGYPHKPGHKPPNIEFGSLPDPPPEPETLPEGEAVTDAPQPDQAEDQVGENPPESNPEEVGNLPSPDMGDGEQGEADPLESERPEPIGELPPPDLRQDEDDRVHLEADPTRSDNIIDAPALPQQPSIDLMTADPPEPVEQLEAIAASPRSVEFDDVEPAGEPRGQLDAPDMVGDDDEDMEPWGDVVAIDGHDATQPPMLASVDGGEPEPLGSPDMGGGSGNKPSGDIEGPPSPDDDSERGQLDSPNAGGSPRVRWGDDVFSGLDLNEKIDALLRMVAELPTRDDLRLG